MTGGTGMLGGALRPALGERPVVLLGRTRSALLPNESWAPFDLRGPVGLPCLPADSIFCHLAYAMADGVHNVDYTRQAIAAVNLSGSVSHVVMISSASVYGGVTTGLIDEDTALRPDSPYARTKAACEAAWFDELAPDCRLTVLRPTAIVGESGAGIEALARDAIERPFRGTVKRMLQYRNTVHLVAVENVVAAVRFVMGRPGAARELFIVSDDDAAPNSCYPSMQDFVRAQVGLRPLRAAPLPQVLARPLGAVVGKPLGVRRTFTTARLEHAGFRRPTRLEDQLSDVIRSRFSQRVD